MTAAPCGCAPPDCHILESLRRSYTCSVRRLRIGSQVSGNHEEHYSFKG